MQKLRELGYFSQITCSNLKLSNFKLNPRQNESLFYYLLNNI